MCRRFLNFLISLNIFKFLNEVTTRQHYKFILIMLLIMVFGLFFAEYIYSLQGILKLLFLFAAILYTLAYIVNLVKGTMLSQGDWENSLVAFYYCLWFIALVVVFFVLVYKLILFMPQVLC